MTKVQLISDVAEAMGETKAKAGRMLDAFLENITAALKDGIELTIPGFGKFSVKNVAARTARNPITSDPVNVPAKRKVVFKAQKALKDAVQGA